MRRWRVRLRTLFLVASLGSAALAIVATAAAADGFIRERLLGIMPADEAAALAETLRSTILLTGLGAAAAAFLLGLALAATLTAPLRGLRAELLRRLRRAAPQPLEMSGIAEVDALVRAVDLFADEMASHAQRLYRERSEMALLVNAVSEGIMQLEPGARVVRVNPAARSLLGLPVSAEGQPVASLVRHGELRRMLELAADGADVPTCEVTIDERRLLVAARPLFRASHTPPRASDTAAAVSGERPAVPGAASVGQAPPIAVPGVQPTAQGAASATPHALTGGQRTSPAPGARPATLGAWPAASPAPSAAGSSARAGAVVAFADLTELRRLEGVRRDFVANASHELKTPLTSIRGYAETLLDDTLPTELRRQFLEAVRSNAERLQRIVDDLLDLSRFESGGWRPELTEVAVGELAQQAWIAFETRATAQRVAFAVHSETDRGAWADAAALRHVFSNLFDNALRHTQADGRTTVRVADDGGSERLTIEVQDDGAGIPGDALPRIFERFYRVDPARSRAEGGTGLGLSIVRHLVEAMGGDVAATSELGKGTTIRVRLPASTQAVTEADAPKNDVKEPTWTNEAT